MCLGTSLATQASRRAALTVVVSRRCDNIRLFYLYVRSSSGMDAVTPLQQSVLDDIDGETNQQIEPESRQKKGHRRVLESSASEDEGPPAK